MSNPYTPLKRSQAHDWHPADVLAALTKAGHRLDRIGPLLGLDRSAGGKALHQKPWPTVKAKIAALIGERPHKIWPSVFDENDEPYPFRRNRRSHKLAALRNVCRTASADGQAG